MKIVWAWVALFALIVSSCSPRANVAGGGGRGAGGSAAGEGGVPAGDGGGTARGGGGAVGGAISSACSGAVHSPTDPGPTQATLPLTTPGGFTITTIATAPSARQMVALPNGDLLIATMGAYLYLVPNADAPIPPGPLLIFATTGEGAAQGVAFDQSSCTVYVSAQHNIYAIAYTDAQLSATAGTLIASVRTGDVSPNRPSGDTDNHVTTSVAVAGGVLYAGVGSSCNACVETDPTRASIQRMDLSGANMATRATRIRNGIALAPNPATGTLWAGGAGQDSLPVGHPYEFFDAVTVHPGVADYGWPDCEEDHVAYTADASCGATVAPLVELPAYSTIIGAAFYPVVETGPYSFPAAYRGGVFLAAHGSWHTNADGTYASPPQVVFVPMNGDAPKIGANWSDPTQQWTTFVAGFQSSDGKTRVARPTGLAVGPLGSLFIADDQNGYIYRVRPN
jgi:glucose/arabinose dehydrogenase